jgi:Secretion system C-terminal sorting domain/Outer membrane protein Omp28
MIKNLTDYKPYFLTKNLTLMKKNFTLILLLTIITPLSIFSQNKKFALLEHFTNTWCPICANTNPGFYTVINVENNKDIHHISYHSSIPYTQCPLYQLNKTEQDARKTLYNLQGTPSVSINGAALTSAGNVTANTITTATTGTSPISIKVTETTGTARTATIEVKKGSTFDDANNYKLYAAIVEKKLAFNAQNGEKTHYNVFRKWAKATPDTYNPAGAATQTYTYNYAIENGWIASEIYVLAFVQSGTGNAIINSGTRFDVTSAVEEPSIDEFVQVFPNPTSGKFVLTFDKVKPQQITVTNITGQVVETAVLNNNSRYEMDLNKQANGIYFVKVQTTEGVAIKQIVKQ